MGIRPMSDFDANSVQRLVDDVNYLLDVGDVGLYELLWILRGRCQPGTRQDWIRISTAAAERVLRSGRAKLAWLEWPATPAEGGEITFDGGGGKDPWQEPTDADTVYAALLPT